MLNGGIQGSGACHGDAQQCRIEGVNVIEMHHWHSFTTYLSYDINRKNEYEEYKEDDQMYIGENHDKL